MDVPTSHARAHQLLARLEEHRRYLERLICKIAGESEAPDLVQEVFVTACRKIDSFRGDASMRTWLRRIATNRAINELSAHTRRRAREAAGSFLHEPRAACPFELTAARQTQRKLRSSYADMPAPWKETLHARVDDEHTLSRIAADASVSVGTAHRRERLAKERLALAFEA